MQAASGRNFAGQRFGPRPLDLDIIFYSNQHVQHDRLCIPHPRWQERDFVKAPLLDLFTPEEDLSHNPWQGLAEKLAAVRNNQRPNQGSVHCLYKSILAAKVLLSFAAASCLIRLHLDLRISKDNSRLCLGVAAAPVVCFAHRADFQ